jgi:hypothetical protein
MHPDQLSASAIWGEPSDTVAAAIARLSTSARRATARACDLRAGEVWAVGRRGDLTWSVECFACAWMTHGHTSSAAAARALRGHLDGDCPGDGYAAAMGLGAP